MAVSRSMWYSSLDSVWLGATTIESPEEEEEEDDEEEGLERDVTYYILTAIYPLSVPKCNVSSLGHSPSLHKNFMEISWVVFV